MLALTVIVCLACALNWRALLCGKCAPLPEIERAEDLLELAQGVQVSD